MLILTRRIDEEVVIGNKDVLVTVLGVKGYQVNLGFQALPIIPIHRAEVYQRILVEQKNEISEFFTSPLRIQA